MFPDPTDRYLLNPLDDVQGTQNMILQIIRRIEQLEAGTPGIPSAPPPPGTPHPDLIFTALSASPGAPNIGDAVTFTWTVKNQGNDPVVAGTNINVNLYVDGVHITHGNYTGGLASGASATWDSVSSINAGGTWSASQGAHTIEARVNEAGTIVEANTTNNNRVITVTTATPPAGTPDLVVSALAASPASPAQGQAVTFSFTLTNQGTGAIASGVTIINNVTVDGVVVTHADYAGGLAAGASTNLTTTTGGTWTATPGAHTVQAVANATNTVAESNSANNTTNLSLTVAGQQGGVDLVVTALSASPAAPAVGGSVTFSVTIQNIGGVTMPAQTGPVMGCGIYIDGVATPATWMNFNTALAAGASITLDTATSLFAGGPWTATVGSHQIDAFVNDTNTFTETDRTNNHRTMSLVVAPPPDPNAAVIDRGSTTAITAGTTLVGSSFTPAAGSLIVVITEGTTI